MHRSPELESEYILQTAPATTPISVAELKVQLRIPAADTSEDTYLATVIGAAVAWGEAFTMRSFINRVHYVYLDRMPTELTIRKSPLVSVDAVDFMIDGTFVTESVDTYYATASPVWASIVLAPGASWPTPDVRRQSVRMTITDGYGAAASDVPDGIRQALLTHAAEIYTSRGDSCGPEVAEAPSVARALYAPFVIHSVFPAGPNG